MIGNRIRLDVVEPGDEKFMIDWENDPHNWEVSESKGPFSMQEIADFIRTCNDLAKCHQVRYIIRSHSDLRPMGALDLFNYNPIKKTAGIGILIANASDRNQGFAKEALALLESILQTSQEVVQLEALVYTDNNASIRLFETAGYAHAENRKFKNKLAYSFIKQLS